MIIKGHKNKKISVAKDIANIFYAILNTLDSIDKDKEHFYVICLDSSNKIKLIDLVSVGLLDKAMVHPREVFRRAIMEGSAAIICGHNHPGGDLTPSQADIRTTDQLKEGGKLLGIRFLDHIIINNEGEHFSFQEAGMMG